METVKGPVVASGFAGGREEQIGGAQGIFFKAVKLICMILLTVERCHCMFVKTQRMHNANHEPYCKLLTAVNNISIPVNYSTLL